MSAFSINVTGFYWLNGTPDNPADLCLHGQAEAVIGGHKLEYDATVSATALYLLKSLTEDHIMGKDNQMLPCCGFCFLPDCEFQNVRILGCGNGVDWTVRHRRGAVILELADGTTETVPMDAYRKKVFRFADKVEGFYRSCAPKLLPEDPWERNGYLAFWREWRRRRHS